MSIDSIPVHVIHAPAGEPGLTGNALALLREIAEMLRRLMATGEASTIDLSALPLTPADLDWLHAKLGEGEILATLQADGESTFSETAVSGVWWVVHHNEQGTVTSQFIEVCFVPALIKAHPQDVQTGQEYLELLIQDL